MAKPKRRLHSAAEIRNAGRIWEMYAASSGSCEIRDFRRGNDGKITSVLLELRTTLPTVFGFVLDIGGPPVHTDLWPDHRTAFKQQHDARYHYVYYTGTHPLEVTETVRRRTQYTWSDLVVRAAQNGVLEAEVTLPDMVTPQTRVTTDGRRVWHDGSWQIAISMVLLPEPDEFGQLTTWPGGYATRRWVGCTDPVDNDHLYLQKK
ncbi:MAG: hypothetical protein FJ100_14905 [Deltaproteobacteria bacterium]|nr:hypothetical protein [Deltaproteobacteria bacterium]